MWILFFGNTYPMRESNFSSQLRQHLAVQADFRRAEAALAAVRGDMAIWRWLFDPELEMSTWQADRQRTIRYHHGGLHEGYIGKLLVCQSGDLHDLMLAMTIETCTICGSDNAEFKVDNDGMVWMACPSPSCAPLVKTPKLETVVAAMQSWNQMMTKTAEIFKDIEVND